MTSQLSMSAADSAFLYRGVSSAFHATNGGRLKPKVRGSFSHRFGWDQPAIKWDSAITWDSTKTNAVIRHQLNQEGFPTAGISTTPHFVRALFYVRGRDGVAGGYVYKINRALLSSLGVEQFVVSQFCVPSVAEDDEVILVTKDGEELPIELVVEIVEVPALVRSAT